MLTLQELSDRREIDDLLVAYCYAIDFHQWDELDRIFTGDATLDFTGTGGERGDLPAMKAWLPTALGHFAGHQHLVATSHVELDGDRATGRTMCHNPMPFEADGRAQLLIVGLWYLDTFRRTAAGWRISSRAQLRAFLHAT